MRGAEMTHKETDMNFPENPVEDLASSVYHALSFGLPDIEHEVIDSDGKTVAEMKKSNLPISQWPRKKALRRPTMRDLARVLLFQETWGGGALGFGGMSTAAMTTANTVVIFSQCRKWVAVYWAGRLGYLVRTNGASSQFLEDIKNGKTLSRREASLKYGDAVVIP